MISAPASILEAAYARATATVATPAVVDSSVAVMIASCVRSRRDRGHALAAFVSRHRLPCDLDGTVAGTRVPTSARAVSAEAVRHDVQLVFDELERCRTIPADALAKTIRQLVLLREEMDRRIGLLLKPQRDGYGHPLSSEAIVMLMRQYLACRSASRLPVLMVAAAYAAVAGLVGESTKPLFSHHADDEQTGAVGDLEIRLTDEAHTVTSYEMNLKPVTQEDVDRAVTKIVAHEPPIQNLLFVTTESAEPAVHDYAASYYDRLGVEIAILDCLEFVRHFLHFFHRHRMAFLEAYQALLLAEPESAVRQELKEAFLSLRLAAETGGEP